MGQKKAPERGPFLIPFFGCRRGFSDLRSEVFLPAAGGIAISFVRKKWRKKRTRLRSSRSFGRAGRAAPRARGPPNDISFFYSYP